MAYTPPVNDQTYYITKYALTGGIAKVKGHLCEDRRLDGTLLEDYGGRMISVVWEGRSLPTYFHMGEWHTTLEAAQARVEEMKAAKLKSLRKQVAKYETLSVSFMPIDDRTALAGALRTEE